MSLIKKTIVLGDKVPLGHLTVVKLGNTVGLKIRLKSFGNDMHLVFKAGNSAPMLFPIPSESCEIEKLMDFDDDATLSAVVLCKDKIFATGGTGKITSAEISALIAPQKVAETIIEQPKVVVVEPTIEKEDVLETAVEALDNSTEALNNATQSLDSAVEILAQHTANADKKNEETVDCAENDDKMRPENTTADGFKFFRPQQTSGFYTAVKDKVGELMTVYPHDYELENILPDSSVVKVEYEKGEFYVVGTLSDNGAVTHLVYGVRGLGSVLPPKEVENVSQFLPLQEGSDLGYWVILQDAETGETIKN